MNNRQKIIFIIAIIAALFAVIFGAIFFYLFLPKQTALVTPVKQATIDETQIATGAQNVTNHSLVPIVSNQWYSSLFTAKPESIFAFPLAYKVTSAGLGFSYPDVKKTPNTIFGSYDEDFSVGFASDLGKPKVTAVGDFSVGVTVTNSKNEIMSFTLAHGIPFTAIHTTGKTVVITFPNTYTLYDQNQPIAASAKSLVTDSFVITAKNHSYLISLDKKTNITLEKTIISLDNPTKIFVGLLDDKSHYEAFKAIANTEVTGTQAEPTITVNKVKRTYTVATTEEAPLVALFPHQNDTLGTAQSEIGSYATIRGVMRLVKTNTFITSIAKTVPSDSFQKTTRNQTEVIDQIKKDITDVMKDGNKPNSGDYYLGTWLGKVDNLLLLADVYDLQNEKTNLLQFVEPIFQQSLGGFHYDTTKTSLIADKPEFGNENLNDHHFHYGYYIRTGAVLSKFDPQFANKIKDGVNAMLADIATTNRDNSKYPYIRNFDVYESHSWADGMGATPDGNNQESSSEAVNAWYGVYLWSKTTNNADLEKYALYLYNSEILGAKYYWFDTTGIYTKPYNHTIGTIVWCGKVDFSTWFSPETNMKYGIELLPFTPASSYLGTFPDFTKYDDDFRTSGGDETMSWGDLLVMWKSFYNPTQALQVKDKATKLEGNNTRAMLLYTLYKNAEK